MRTKRYTVVIAGLMPEIVTQNILVKIWCTLRRTNKTAVSTEISH